MKAKGRGRGVKKAKTDRLKTSFKRAYLTKSQAARVLQITNAEFERLVILKGVYPREPRRFDGSSGKDVAEQLGISEPTVSRHLQRVRSLLRNRLSEAIATYSFTEDEYREADRAGLAGEDAMFDDGLREIFHQQSQLILQDEAAVSGAF